MSKVVIFGGGGRLGRAFIAQNKGKHEIVAVVRNSQSVHALSQQLGVGARVFDIEASKAVDVAALLAETRANAVIWAVAVAADAGSDRTRAVDYEAAVKLFKACAEAGVDRLLFISSMDVHPRGECPGYYSQASREASKIAWSLRGVYMESKYEAELALHSTSLAYTVLRPCNLTDEAARGARLGAEQLVRDGAKFDPPTLENLAAAAPTTSREVVAQVMLACLANKGSVGRTWDVVDGSAGAEAEVTRCIAEGVDAWRQ